MAKTAENQRVFSMLLKQQVGDIVKPKLVEVLSEVAEWMVGVIDADFEIFESGGNGQFPVYSGNMRDSTGVGVYIDGALTAYRPTKRAKSKQHDEIRNIYDIVGAEYLDAALKAASTEFPNGIWIVLFSTVPYAYDVNYYGSPWGRGVDYFGELSDSLKRGVFFGLRPLSTLST